MERKRGSWPLAAAVNVLAAGLMLACFAAGERALAPLADLPASQTIAGLGHPEAEGQLDINSATGQELMELPGIGQVRAEAIVAYREEHGPFRYPEELIRVEGIGEGLLTDILDMITVGGG